MDYPSTPYEGKLPRCAGVMCTATRRIAVASTTASSMKPITGGGVHSVRVGREQQFAFRPAPLKDAEDYLVRVSDQWDRVLLRLKAFVEE